MWAKCWVWGLAGKEDSLQKSFGHFLLIHFGISWAASWGWFGAVRTSLPAQHF